MKGKVLTEGTPWKLILSFAMPVLAGILLQQLYNTVDTIIVGNFAGEAALSAVGTTACFTFFFLAIANGFSAGVGVIVAQLFGAKREKELRASASTGIILLMGMGLIVTIVGILICGGVLKYALAVPEEFLDMAIIYFRFYCLGLIFQFGYNIIASILRAVGDSKASLYFLLISSVLNVILDLLFVAGLHMGTVGAAIATDISQAVSFFAALFYMYRRYPVFHFKLHEFTYESHRAVEALKVGFPMALQQMIVSLGFFFIQRAVNQYGQAMTASFTVGQRIESYLTMPATAFQVTMATYTGQNIGAGKPERIKKGAMQAVILSELITVMISILCVVFTEPITGMFGLSEQAAVYCTQHIQVTAFLLLILAAYFPLFGVFQGTGHGFVATLAATSALTMRVICTYTLCNIPIFGYRIIWWNAIFGFMTAGTIAWIYFMSEKWKKV